MKLKNIKPAPAAKATKTSPATAKAKKPVPSSKASGSVKPEGVITADTFDGKTFFVMSKAPTIQIKKEATGRKIPDDMKPGILTITGPHGTLAHNVRHSGSIYARQVGARDRFGCLSAIEKATKELAVKIVSLKDLVAQAKKIGHAATIVRQSDDAEFTGIYVTEPGKSYTVFLAIDKSGTVTVMNTEPVRHYNAKPVQFVEKTKLDFAKVSARIK